MAERMSHSPGPVSYHIHQGESIVVALFSSVVMTLNAKFRILYDDGSTDTCIVDDFATGSTRVGEQAKSVWIAREHGAIVEGTAQISGGTAAQPKRGQTYVRASIVPTPEGGPSLAMLFQGYLYRGFSPTLGTNIEPGPGGGRGNLRTVTGTNPAANTEASEAVPANAIWRLLSWSIVLVTDANVANRNTNLIADDGTTANRSWFILSTFAHAASLTRTHLFFIGNDTVSPVSSPVTTDTDVIGHLGNLPDYVLRPASRIRTNTTAIQVGDDYAAPIFQVEEWIDP